MENFGKDFEELANITQPRDEANGMYAVVICEGCGVIQVDTKGNCMSLDCQGDHRKGKESGNNVLAT